MSHDVPVTGGALIPPAEPVKVWRLPPTDPVVAGVADTADDDAAFETEVETEDATEVDAVLALEPGAPAPPVATVNWDRGLRRLLW